ncbi:MAG: GNAT family N-acetyltransferase [Parvularculaceae bacterium]|nr:GNAT family N-acetyltransferase [Parvularculaceae bacterium]
MSIVLETPRLKLRPIAAEDFEPYAAMMAAPAVARFLTLDGAPQSRANAWRAFASLVGHWTIRGYGMFSMIEKASGRWVGRAGPWNPEGWPQIECGWGVAPEFWGKGYAPEAATAAIDWTFAARPELVRIISLIAAANANSQAVARKIGERNTGEIFMIEHVAVEIWAVSREDWRAARC